MSGQFSGGASPAVGRRRATAFGARTTSRQAGSAIAAFGAGAGGMLAIAEPVVQRRQRDRDEQDPYWNRDCFDRLAASKKMKPPEVRRLRPPRRNASFNSSGDYCPIPGIDHKKATRNDRHLTNGLNRNPRRVPYAPHPHDQQQRRQHRAAPFDRGPQSAAANLHDTIVSRRGATAFGTRTISRQAGSAVAAFGAGAGRVFAIVTPYQECWRGGEHRMEPNRDCRKRLCPSANECDR
jgi:hypothetical protein